MCRFWSKARIAGVLCLQHRDIRYWDEDDVGFANTTGLMLALSMEAAQRQEAESRIEHLAWYDALTGLPNRNLLRETMRDMIMTASNRKRRMAAMLIDLDRFKDVNDTLGHLVGDALIKSAADVLRETVGDDGTVARLGGDEFVVLISEFVHRQEVALLAARIAQALHRTDLVPNIDTQVSASIGVALFPEHGRDMSTLLKNADAAMYQAKRDGRNQFSFFNPIRYERAAREVQLGIELVKAVQSERPQFICEYQPQIEMASGRVVGLEALIRWNHPVHGMLTPDRFIGVAEVSGLSERITRWVLNEVCSQINRWRLGAARLRRAGRRQRRGTRDGFNRAADPGPQRARQARHRAAADRARDHRAHAGQGKRDQQRRAGRARLARCRAGAR